MNCDEFQLFADAYVDGEFDERERADMEAHLAQCDCCRAQAEFKLKFKEAFRDTLSQTGAPEGLRQRIIDEIAQSEDVEASNSSRSAWRYAVIATPLAAGIALVFAFISPDLSVAPATSEQLPVVESTVDWHRGDFPVEVTGPTSSDVSRWFRGKVDFPVRLPQFHNEQVRLIGGRLAHVKDRRAAYVLYDVDGARLSVMIFHGDDLKVPADRVRKIGDRDVVLMNSKGYGVAILKNSGVTYTMTSELPEEQLVDLVDASLRH